MTFTQLVDFLQNRMRMSHIYQPLMLVKLFKNEAKLLGFPPQFSTNVANNLLAKTKEFALW